MYSLHNLTSDVLVIVLQLQHNCNTTFCIISALNNYFNCCFNFFSTTRKGVFCHSVSFISSKLETSNIIRLYRNMCSIAEHSSWLKTLSTHSNALELIKILKGHKAY